VTYTCDSGYQSIGAVSSACVAATLKWQLAPPSCQGLVCPTLDKPTNGQVAVGNSYKYPATATYTCDQGYERETGDATRTCIVSNSITSWAGSATTCRGVLCKAQANLAFGRVTVPDGARYPAYVLC
jgi:CUB/sushi domain-containing protein